MTALIESISCRLFICLPHCPPYPRLLISRNIRPVFFLVNLIQYMDFIFYNISTGGFAPSFSFQEHRDGCGGSPVLRGEAIWPPFMPLQAVEWSSNKSPDTLLIFSLFLWVFFHLLLFFFSAWKCSFAAARACLSLNSLRALGLSQTESFFFFACLSLH